MAQPPADPSKDLAGLREWVAQLERRVSDLEHEERRASLRRRRGLWAMAIAGGLYLLFLYWVTRSTQLP